MTNPSKCARARLTPTGANEIHHSVANAADCGAMLVDRREAGRLLGVSPGTIDNLRIRGELPSLKILARRLYDVEDLRALIEARKEVRGHE